MRQRRRIGDTSVCLFARCIPNDFPFVLNLSLPDSFCPYKANLFDNPVLAIEVTEVITESLSWNSRQHKIINSVFPMFLISINWASEQSMNYQKTQLGFPGGAVVKNPPANAGDMGSIPGPGRSHMPQSN